MTSNNFFLFPCASNTTQDLTFARQILFHWLNLQPTNGLFRRSYQVPEYISYFSSAGVIHHDPDNLGRKEFTWAFGFSGLNLVHGGEAAGRAPGQEAEGSHLELHAQSNLRAQSPRQMLPPAKPHLLNSPSYAATWGASLQASQPKRDIFIQTTTLT